MKRIHIFLISLLFITMMSSFLFAQDTHTIDFEPAGVGADWNWTMSENSDNPPLEFIANPVSGGINTTATVAMFTARADGNPWALCHTSDDGEYTFDADNSIITIMVYKTVISDIGLKVEGMSGAPQLVVANTVINEWEEITFDFSDYIGSSYGTMVIIPDFLARDEEHIIYFDNIQIPDGEVAPPPVEPTIAAPVPTVDEANVISIYSDAYTNLAGTDFNPLWGQSTAVTVDYQIAGTNTIKYENLNFQGTQFTNQDVSEQDFLHVDFWTPNATSLSFFLIGAGGETNYDFTVENETWVSVDIPLSHYTPPVNLADVFQFKVTGNGTVWFDNWYFWNDPNAVSSDATLSDLQVDGTTIEGFSAEVLSYDVVLAEGTTIVPTVTASTTDANASYVINDAAALPGTTDIVVTAEDGTTALTYSINFTVAGPIPEPTVSATAPAQNEEDVISIFSDTYTDLDGTGFTPGWGQSTIVTTEELEGNFMLKYDNFNFQGTQLAGNQDLSLMEYIHIDMWTANATVVQMSPISATTGEFLYSLTPIAMESWNSYDIPLADFVGVGMSDIHQLKFDGQAGVTPSTIYLDNIYFWKTPTAAGADATLSDLQVDGTTLEGFSTAILSYDIMLAEGTTTVPTVTATTNDPAAGFVVNDAAAIPGTTEVVVTAENGTTMLTYSVNFLLPDPEPTVSAPAPAQNEEDVISIFSDTYTDLAGTDFNPGWGQSTILTTEEIDGNFMLKYDNFNYQGTQLAGNQDLSLMEYVHIDMWTADATVVEVSPISATTGEFLYSLTPIAAQSWNSYDIPLADFTNVSMSDIHQLKFNGQAGVTPSTLYLDNIYFWKNPTVEGADATLSDLQVDGTTIEGFTPTILSYDAMLAEGTTIVPTVTATTNDEGASFVVNDAAAIPGITEIVVTAENGITMLTYSINFLLPAPAPEVAAPAPAQNEENVISIFSDSYTDLAGTDFNPGWGQTTVVTTEELDGNSMLKYDNFNYQGTQFDGNQDLSAMEYLHIDMWTADATVVQMSPISATSGEFLYSITPIELETWNSYDIPLSAFEGVSMSDIHQLKFDGQAGVSPSTLYLDNIYFYNDGSDIGDTPVTPTRNSLGNNYPNPFNPVTNISFSLVEPGYVTLKIYDTKGRVVETLVNGNRTADRYQLSWEAKDVASGVYFYRLEVDHKPISTKRMILLK